MIEAEESAKVERFAVEARFYSRLSGKNVKCHLCPRSCVVAEGERGHCGVRENREGALYTVVYARIGAAHVDPVEKKPLFHFLPGSLAFSLGTAGCNVHCRFCQNWNLAQSRPEQVAADYLPPAKAAELAALHGCRSIAFTYNEPVVFSEYVMDTADAAHEAGIHSLAVSNGYMQTGALRAVYGKLDAVKIDLKAFSDAYYRQVVKGRLKPVLESIATLRELGKWIEIVYLTVPTMNDGEDELRELARWMLANVGADVPLHFTQFHPDYLMKNLPVTPVATLERARSLAMAEGLRYVYIGNVAGHEGENTYCPRCGRVLVERRGMGTHQVLIRNGACPFCSQAVPGVWPR